MKHRLLIAGAALAVVAAACGGSADDSPADAAVATTAAAVGDATQTTADPGPAPAIGVLPEGPSALDTSSADEFPPPLVDPGDILSGGPPPDGIPSIDEPVFINVIDSLDLLQTSAPVVALEINGDARAYPIEVLVWHEIVNDTVGGVPVAVTYCPLCNSAVTYRREIRGVETTFGTSGRLFASALVMYDRATESLWTHFDGRAVVGLLTGEELEAIASPLLSWGDFIEAYPNGTVLDPAQTGFNRDYGRNPYIGYDNVGSEPFLFTGITDPRAASKQRIVGIELDDEAKAFTLEAISGGAAKATNTTVGNTDIVIFWKTGQSSAVDAGSVDEGRDVGSVSVFLPVVDGQELTFTADGDIFVDDQTGSEWSGLGEALSGELEGARLERVNHLDTFWFAWATYSPGTELVDVAG
jgi:hypothetical protein